MIEEIDFSKIPEFIEDEKVQEIVKNEQYHDKYNKETGKYAIWQGSITSGYLEWFKKNQDTLVDEINNEIEDSVEEIYEEVEQLDDIEYASLDGYENVIENFKDFKEDEIKEVLISSGSYDLKSLEVDVDKIVKTFNGISIKEALCVLIEMEDMKGLVLEGIQLQREKSKAKKKEKIQSKKAKEPKKESKEIISGFNIQKKQSSIHVKKKANIPIQKKASIKQPVKKKVKSINMAGGISLQKAKVPNISNSKVPTKKISTPQKKPVKMKNSNVKFSKKVFDKVKPTVFNVTFEESWKTLIDEGKEKKKKGIKRVKGIITLLGGDTGAGKTHLAVDMVNSPERDLGYRLIPSGSPVYLLMSDPAPEDEVDRNYYDHKWEDIFPVNCYVRDESTGRIDPVRTLANYNRYLSGLRDRDVGTVVIEDWTVYCNLVLYAYLKESGGKGHKGIEFNDFLVPKKKVSITEYQFKAKIIDEILMCFQNDYKLNFVLVANLKEETINTGDSLYDFEKTGKMMEDVQKGTDRKVDVVARMEKVVRGDKIYRQLTITKSRFEGEVLDMENVVMMSPSASKFVKHIVELYLQQ